MSSLTLQLRSPSTALTPASQPSPAHLPQVPSPFDFSKASSSSSQASLGPSQTSSYTSLDSPLRHDHKSRHRVDNPQVTTINTWIYSSTENTAKMGVFADVIKRCNKFEEPLESMYEFSIMDNSVPLGYMLPKFAEEMKWGNTSFDVSEKDLKIRLNPTVKGGDNAGDVCAKEFVKLAEVNKNGFNGAFKNWLIKKEDFQSLRGVDSQLGNLKIPSCLRGIFGVVTTGVHMNVYTVSNVDGQESISVWVARRTNNVTYPGKLDQLVAGAMDPEDKFEPLQTLKREAMEEAGLTVDKSNEMVHFEDETIGKVQQGNRVFFYDLKDQVAGSSEQGHVEPGLRYTYDLLVDAQFTPKVAEPENIAYFQLLTVNEIKETLKKGEWKPNCGLVVLDFLLRHDQIQPEEDEYLGELATDLQKKLPFKNI